MFAVLPHLTALPVIPLNIKNNNTMTTFNKDFMPQQGDYHKLLVYRKA